MVEVGQRVTIPSSGHAIEIARFIGEGSQGSVFEAVPVSGSGSSVAVKWYFPHTATREQRSAIESLVERGAPSRNFLWPTEILEIPKDPTFGYIMPLRPQSFSGLADLLSGRVDVPFSTVCRLCLQLADDFLRLHSQGLCYRDISFGNIFLNATTGQPLICDNDNVGIDGRGPVSVLGTRRFMAPEIVRREAVPSSTTDLYSLSVLLFYLLMAGHPLVGRRESEVACWDEGAESYLFGRGPLFVFDPDDHSNEPDPAMHASVIRSWELYPAYVRDLFTQAFTRGLRDPVNGRVRESVWRATMARLLDSVHRCETCGRENFYEVARGPGMCWFCERQLSKPVILSVNQHRIVASVGAQIYAHHLGRDYDLGAVVGEVVANPRRPEMIGLRNMTATTWWGWLPGGSSQVVEPERTLRLDVGTRIDLGRGMNVLVES